MFMLLPVDGCLYLFPTNPCVLLFLTSRGCDVQIFIYFRLLGMYLYCLRSKVQWLMVIFWRQRLEERSKFGTVSFG